MPLSCYGLGKCPNDGGLGKCPNDESTHVQWIRQIVFAYKSTGSVSSGIVKNRVCDEANQL
jgi:hypothetical protein